MKLFISWSDETSHAIALLLGDWIPSVIQAVETYVSLEDLRKGTGWVNDVSKELNQSSFGILCVVPGTMGAPWLNFEAGVLSKSLGVSNVIPLLIDVETSELDDGPLAQFPSVNFKKNDMYRMLETINEKTERGRLSEDRLRNTFDIWWPKLKLDVESIRKEEREEADPPEKATGAEEPEKATEAEEPEKATEAEEPERTTEAEEPEKATEAEEPEKATEAEEPERTTEADKSKKTPKRAVEAARKSEALKPQDPVKPAKKTAVKPAPEEIEIEMLIVLYDPPAYTPRTADAVGFKVDISPQKAREHLDKLERNNYVREHLFVGRPKEYSLAPKGRDYLTKNDLLKKRRGR